MAINDILAKAGVDQEVFNKSEAQSVSTFELIPSGAYKANVTELITFKTEKGATQLKVVVKLKDSGKELKEFQNLNKKDGTPNEIGTATFRHILDAFGPAVDNLTTAEEEVVGYKEKVKVSVVKGTENIDIIVLVREVHQDGADFEDTNEIEGFLRIDGTNAKGEELVSKFMEKIEEKPVRIKKSKGGSSSKSAGKVDEKAKADLDNLV